MAHFVQFKNIRWFVEVCTMNIRLYNTKAKQVTFFVISLRIVETD